MPAPQHIASLLEDTGARPAAGTKQRPPPGRLGRYEIVHEIGRGAMGVVYRARDPVINREVALKTIPLAAEFEGRELEEARAKFFREAETAGRLSHPHIVTIYDAGEQDGTAYIAMELLRGRHLVEYAAAAQPAATGDRHRGDRTARRRACTTRTSRASCTGT